MNISIEHILQCNKTEPLAEASGRMVDQMNENGVAQDSGVLCILVCYAKLNNSVQN